MKNKKIISIAIACNFMIANSFQIVNAMELTKYENVNVNSINEYESNNLEKITELENKKINSSVFAGTYSDGVECIEDLNSHALRISGSGSITVSTPNNTEQNKLEGYQIVVHEGFKGILNLNGVNIEHPGSAFVIKGFENKKTDLIINLVEKSKNTFSNSKIYSKFPLISLVGEECDVRIISDAKEKNNIGELNIFTIGGAGIGSVDDNDRYCGNISIDSGLVEIISKGDSVGIGSGNNASFGNISINGGDIKIRTEKGAGIGSGDSGNCGNISVNDGTVDIISSGSGIGSGSDADCGDITINSGDIKIRTEKGVGIGSGDSGNCGNISVNDGTVDIISSGSGIGSGSDADCGNITINSGDIKIRSKNSSGIGSGRSASCGNITINDGKIESISESDSAGIGSETGANCGDITIKGGDILAVSKTYGAGIGSGNGGMDTICGDITIKGGTIKAISNKCSGIGVGFASDCGDITIEGGKVISKGVYGVLAEGKNEDSIVTIKGGLLITNNVNNPWKNRCTGTVIIKNKDNIDIDIDTNENIVDMESEKYVVSEKSNEIILKDEVVINNEDDMIIGSKSDVTVEKALTIDSEKEVINNGILRVPENSRLEINGKLINNGTIYIGKLRNKELKITEGIVNINEKGAIINKGNIVIEENGKLNNKGKIESSGLISGSGEILGKIPELDKEKLIKSNTTNSIIINDIKIANKDLEYAIKEGNSNPSEKLEWKTAINGEVEFKGLKSGTTYTIFVRYKDAIDSRYSSLVIKTEQVNIGGGNGGTSNGNDESQLYTHEKIEGLDRYETAAKVADKLGSYDNVVLVNASSTMSDGLSASGLAGKEDAAILLTKKDSIPKATMDRLKKVKKVYIIGGESAISQKVYNEITKNVPNIKVERIGGKTRVETSELVAKKIGNYSNAFVVNGFKGEADAMSASSIAARYEAPILLTNGKTSTHDKKTGVSYYVVGGNSVVNNEVVKKYNAKRLAGDDRYETNREVIDEFYSGSDKLYIANGETLVDALTASTIAKNNGIVLVNKKSDKSILKDKNTVQVGGMDFEIDFE